MHRFLKSSFCGLRVLVTVTNGLGYTEHGPLESPAELRQLAFRLNIFGVLRFIIFLDVSQFDFLLSQAGTQFNNSGIAGNGDY
jgi:hypothetical protein